MKNLFDKNQVKPLISIFETNKKPRILTRQNPPRFRPAPPPMPCGSQREELVSFFLGLFLVLFPLSLVRFSVFGSLKRCLVRFQRHFSYLFTVVFVFSPRIVSSVS